MSFLPYATKDERKEKLNKAFQQDHPKINRQITLSKIMKLKEALVGIFLMKPQPYIEIYSIAHTWVLFERLIYKNVVKKHNRRAYLAACFLISVKIVELFGGTETNVDKLQNMRTDLEILLKSSKGES